MTTVAIVVLTYNSLEETTKPCVESIYRAKTVIDFELVLVDNCSVDGTREYIQQIAATHENISVILNHSNLGYAAGNNIGIRATEASYYVLLNSDTLVTDCWLDKLVAFLGQHAGVGMVGPVSNSVGNEQIIHVEAENEGEIILEGLAWAERCAGDYFHTSMLGFFCVAIRKEVIDSVGVLDENFGIGMFEDDDYCRRVIDSGYQLACMEDVFVLHKGSISFKNANIDGLNELFYQNMNKFEKKHSVRWRSGLTPPKFLRLIEGYIQESSDYPKVIFKIANKIKVMHKFNYDAANDQAMQMAARLNEVYVSLSWKFGSGIARALGKLPFSGLFYRMGMGISKYLGPGRTG